MVSRWWVIGNGLRAMFSNRGVPINKCIKLIQKLEWKPPGGGLPLQVLDKSIVLFREYCITGAG